MKNKFLPISAIFLVSVVYGQTGKDFTSTDYQHATDMLAGNTSKLIDNAIQPQMAARWKIVVQEPGSH